MTSSGTELWDIERVRAFLGAASTKSASRTLSRWSVKAVTYERGASGRPEARFDAGQVRAAKEARPGRGARTDLRRRPHSSTRAGGDQQDQQEP